MLNANRFLSSVTPLSCSFFATLACLQLRFSNHLTYGYFFPFTIALYPTYWVYNNGNRYIEHYSNYKLIERDIVKSYYNKVKDITKSIDIVDEIRKFWNFLSSTITGDVWKEDKKFFDAAQKQLNQFACDSKINSQAKLLCNEEVIEDLRQNMMDDNDLENTIVKSLIENVIYQKIESSWKNGPLAYMLGKHSDENVQQAIKKALKNESIDDLLPKFVLNGYFDKLVYMIAADLCLNFIIRNRQTILDSLINPLFESIYNISNSYIIGPYFVVLHKIENATNIVLHILDISSYYFFSEIESYFTTILKESIVYKDYIYKKSSEYINLIDKKAFDFTNYLENASASMHNKAHVFTIDKVKFLEKGVNTMSSFFGNTETGKTLSSFYEGFVGTAGEFVRLLTKYSLIVTIDCGVLKNILPPIYEKLPYKNLIDEFTKPFDSKFKYGNRDLISPLAVMKFLFVHMAVIKFVKYSFSKLPGALEELGKNAEKVLEITLQLNSDQDAKPFDIVQEFIKSLPDDYLSL